MMDWDEPRKAPTFSLGEALYALSIAELNDRMEQLNAEIRRVEAEIENKRQQARTADAFFKPAAD